MSRNSTSRMFLRSVALAFCARVSLACAHVVEDGKWNDFGSIGWSSTDVNGAPGIGDLGARGTTTCGPAANGASCAPNLCCGPNGVCGTGSYYCVAPSCLFQWGPGCDANQTPAGVNTTFVPRPKFGSTPYGISIRDCNLPGKVALTFDDGPYIYTSDLLDLLKAKGVTATFFLVGNNGGKGQINDPKTGYPALIRRMYDEGHQIGSHTWSHQDLSTLTRQQRYDQIVKNEMALVDILGFFPTYLRPPYESCNADCLADLGNLGYHVANYDIDTLDWQGNYQNSQAIFLNGIKTKSPSHGYIPLAHDIHRGTVYGFAAFMIDNLRAAGYSTALYGECMGDPPQNWYRSPNTGQPYHAFMVGSAASSSVPASAPRLPTISPSLGTAVVEHPSTTVPARSPTAVAGGEGSFGSKSGNGTASGNNTGSPAKSEAGRRFSKTAESFVVLTWTWVAFLIWTCWL